MRFGASIPYSSGVIVSSFFAISGYLAMNLSSSSTSGLCDSTLAYLTSSRISLASSRLLFLNDTSILPITWLKPEMPLYCPVIISRPGLHGYRLAAAQFFVAVKFVVARVFQHAVGMDAGGMGEGVSPHPRLVYRYRHVESIAGELGYFGGQF